jgi:hypothetical protein
MTEDTIDNDSCVVNSQGRRVTVVLEIVLAQSVDAEATAAIDCPASGFLMALSTLREEGALSSG